MPFWHRQSKYTLYFKGDKSVDSSQKNGESFTAFNSNFVKIITIDSDDILAIQISHHEPIRTTVLPAPVPFLTMVDGPGVRLPW